MWSVCVVCEYVSVRGGVFIMCVLYVYVVCVYCMYVLCVCSCVYMCVYDIWKSEVDAGCLPLLYHCLLYFLRTSLTELGT